LIRRKEDKEWVEAVRHVSHDITKAEADLRNLRDWGVVPFLLDGFLTSPGWEAYSSVFARAIPNTDQGDIFWAGISQLFDTIAKTRALVAVRQPGSPIEPAFTEKVLRPGIIALSEARACFTDNPPSGVEAAVA
jgi:hypothetical protein